MKTPTLELLINFKSCPLVAEIELDARSRPDASNTLAIGFPRKGGPGNIGKVAPFDIKIT